MKNKFSIAAFSLFALAMPVYAEAACDPVSLTISSNVQNYNVYSVAVANGWSACEPVVLTINGGVYVWSDNTSLPALDTAGFPSDTQLTIINNGYIMGRGGDGGFLDIYDWSLTQGRDGGPAINLTVPTTISSSSTGFILGGGGGGGAPVVSFCTSGGGGAGGGGSTSTSFGDRIFGGAPGNAGSYGLAAGTWPAGGGGGRVVLGTGGASRFCAKIGPNASGYCFGCSSGDHTGAGYGGSAGGGGSATNNDSGACDSPTGTGGAGGSGGAAGSNGAHFWGGGIMCSDGGAGGGGGWGAPGGMGSDMTTDYYGPSGVGGYGYGTSTAYGGAGGHSVHTNCFPLTWTGGFPGGHVLGDVTRNQTQGLGTCPLAGAISVSSNMAGASWTITGPVMLTGSGMSTMYASEPLGVYTITWAPISGYTTPVPQSLSIASAGATISFVGNYAPLSNVNLVAGPVTPVVAAVASLTTFSSTVSNVGIDPTSTNFSNFFQVASGASGSGVITDLPSSSMAILSSGGSAVASASYTFPSAGTYSMRACADATSSLGGGIIVEADEMNNCGLWTDIVVQASPIISFTVNGSTGPIALVQGDTETMVWSASDATSCIASSSDIWSGVKSPAGGTSSQTANITSDFGLSCTGPGGSASKTVHVDVSCTPSTGAYGVCDCSTETKSRTNINAACLFWNESTACDNAEKNVCRDFSWKEVRP